MNFVHFPPFRTFFKGKVMMHSFCTKKMQNARNPLLLKACGRFF
ncbi:hypothetical protein B4099_2117 [Heyndrickxia coagulans]|uniref:Uncharacterized protein n=1 Tax=Heyndrickxia coagulans TaxID=1398 RepID=A0A150KDH2_HEYCO|nr:hypothetical protein B4099_2117 [Heyndrickxia coagulans]